jgi:hypothetical protein
MPECHDVTDDTGIVRPYFAAAAAAVAVQDRKFLSHLLLRKRVDFSSPRVQQQRRHSPSATTSFR